MSLAIPSDCLRPSFTETIAKHLDAGRTVNVFGEEGHGLNRLVEDLGRCCPAGVKFVRVNMRSYADSYAGFLEAICTSLSIAEREGLDFRTLFNRYITTGGNRVWLCMEHFDRLSNQRVDNKNVDTKGYDIDFLNYLNSLHSNNQVALLLTSRLEIMAQELYIGGMRVRGSRLDISQRHPLDDLTFAEIEGQLRRSMPGTPTAKAFFKDKPSIYTPLVTEIAAHEAPLLFLEFIATKVPLPATPLDEFQGLMKFWKKDYAGKFAHTRDLQISDLERWAGKLFDRMTRLLGVSNTLQKTNKKAILILVSVGAIFVAWLNYGKDVWAWISGTFFK